MVAAHIGVLALQGGYQRHVELLAGLGASTRLVRRAAELQGCAGLILPGGESTAITHLLQDAGLLPALRDFAATGSVFGTCAGLILMARTTDARVDSLGLLDALIARNAYGRQSESFQAAVELDLGEGRTSFPGVFIRAPRIQETGRGVTLLGHHRGDPVLIAQGRHLGASFHPELTNDARLHRYWIEQYVKGRSPEAEALCHAI